MSASSGTLLWHYVDKWAEETPGSEALVFGDTRITWRECKDLVDKTAKALLAIGVEKGDRLSGVHHHLHGRFQGGGHLAGAFAEVYGG